MSEEYLGAGLACVVFLVYGWVDACRVNSLWRFAGWAGFLALVLALKSLP